MLRSAILATAGAVVALVVAAPASHATIVSLGPGSPITTNITGMHGPLTFSPTPATQIYEVLGTDYTSNFLPQSPNNVKDGVANIFGVSSSSLTLTFNNESPGSTLSVSDLLGFNYVALHNARGELLFYYDTLQTSFSLSGYNSLSNARFYSAGGTPVPEPASMMLMGAGLVALGFVRRRRPKESEPVS